MHTGDWALRRHQHSTGALPESAGDLVGQELIDVFRLETDEQLFRVVDRH